MLRLKNAVYNEIHLSRPLIINKLKLSFMKISLLKAGLLSVMLSAFFGCMKYDDGENSSLDYDRIDVSFTATLPLKYQLSPDMDFGLYGTCTRKGATSVSMSGTGIARYDHADNSPFYLYATSAEDVLTGLKGDHNYQFFAYYPYNEAYTNATAIPVNVPSQITYRENAETLSPFLVARSTVTSVIAPVPLTFSAPATCQMTIRICNTVCSVLKSLKIHPKNESSWRGQLAFDATYNLVKGELAVTNGTASKSITVDFGSQGYVLQPEYLEVSFLMGEAKYLSGGVELVITDIDGNVKTQQMYDARKTFLAGTSETYTVK